MRMRRCYVCSRRRPVRRLTWRKGEPPACSWSERGACWRAYSREQAKVCRWILGDHDERSRLFWRERLVQHLEMARP